jgi:hypothetical protein
MIRAGDVCVPGKVKPGPIPGETSARAVGDEKRAMKNLWLLCAGLSLVLSSVPASAQINPFKSDRSGATLSATDLDLLGASIGRLNRNPKLEVGAEEEWSNPATGSHGSSAVTRIFMDGHRPCHAIHHEVSAQGRTPPRNYDLTWCRSTDGNWKIKS